MSPFVIETLVGRVGRVIRKNNKATGLVNGIYIYSPNTAILPTHFHWSVGDYESNEAPIPGSFLGYVCTVAGTAEKNIDTGTKATTHIGTNIIDVDDCTLFCPQQWIAVNNSDANFVTFKKSITVRILRVIGLGHRIGPRQRDDPAGYPGQLIVEYPADMEVKKQDIKFQKAIFQKISLT